MKKVNMSLSDRVEEFLGNDDFLIIPHGEYDDAELGLDPMYHDALIYNTVYDGEQKIDGQLVMFKTAYDFPYKVTPEYVVIDVLNRAGDLVEDEEYLHGLVRKNMANYRKDLLMMLVQRYGKNTAKRLITSLCSGAGVPDPSAQ